MGILYLLLKKRRKNMDVLWEQNFRNNILHVREEVTGTWRILRSKFHNLYFWYGVKKWLHKWGLYFVACSMRGERNLQQSCSYQLQERPKHSCLSFRPQNFSSKRTEWKILFNNLSSDTSLKMWIIRKSILEKSENVIQVA